MAVVAGSSDGPLSAMAYAAPEPVGFTGLFFRCVPRTIVRIEWRGLDADDLLVQYILWRTRAKVRHAEEPVQLVQGLCDEDQPVKRGHSDFFLLLTFLSSGAGHCGSLSLLLHCLLEFVCYLFAFCLESFDDASGPSR